MSFTSWLRNLQSVCHLGTATRKSRRAARREPSKRSRLHLEVLEDRLTPSFSPAVSFPVAPNPLAVVTGDFNNDGHLDLATVARDAGTISVLLGDGAGGFGAAIDSYVGSHETNRVSLTAADFDNDGDDDLAAAIYNPDPAAYWASVGVFLSIGDGTFVVSLSGATTSIPKTLAVAAGDFNNDGNSDLVVSGDNFGVFGDYGLVQVLLGNGHGEFAQMPPAGQYDSGWNAELTVGDLNGDGNLDAVTAIGEFGPGGFALLGDGAGAFSSQYEFGRSAPSSGVAVGEFTGDGIDDLVVAGAWDLDTFVGRGDGTFADPISNDGNGNMLTSVAVSDFNGDGKLDAVTSDAYIGTVSELLGNGNGTLTYARAYAVGSSPSAIAVGDFNGDGRPDAATADAGSNTVSVLRNDGIWTPPPPAVRIGDVTVTEANTGSTAANFIVTLSAASTETITVTYAPGNGTATAGSDYQAASGTLTFAPGETEKAITVLVNGDRLPEPTETFVVNLSARTNATIGDGQGIGTILDDEPRISINDVTVTEGNTGAVNATFIVSLSVAYDVAVTVHYQTANGSATAGSDYAAASGDVTIAAGQTTTTFTTLVIGDRSAEPTENFVINLSAATNGLIVDSQGVGTILDDEPRISISDVTKSEGKKGQITLFTFKVTLSAAYDQPVTMSYCTVNGTAMTGDNDYIAKTGTLTFAPGQTTKTITIEVKGDSKREANETFYLDLFGLSSNALFTKNRGMGTILNDD